MSLAWVDGADAIVDHADVGPVVLDLPLPSSRSSLRRALVVLDAIGAALAWTLALATPIGRATALSGWRLPVAIVGMTIVVLTAAAWQRLYLARVCHVRAVELAGLARTAAACAALGLLIRHPLGIPHSNRWLVVGCILTFFILAAGRSAFGNWLRLRRAEGRYTRPLIIVGCNEETLELTQLLQCHPELGYRLLGVVGERPWIGEWDAPWLGEIADLDTVLTRTGVSSVLVTASAIPPSQLKRLLRDLLRAGQHVHLSSGVAGLDHRRLRPLPLSHHPMFYVENVTQSRLQSVVKRAMDIAVGSVALVAFTPVLFLCALVIKLTDGGSVLFNHERIGRNGQPFKVFKFRTMEPDAELRLEELREQNARIDGPLFKVSEDPRVTRFGRFLRLTSIDELPQLINVLNGTMSLVGPRPALPHEVANFDPELLERLQVPPGITGLWQVEARDNPSFQAYRRLDLFYVENWSVSLDLAILGATAQAVLVRSLRGLSRTADAD